MQLFLAFVNRPFNELQRVGRSDAYASSYNLESETYVPLPKDDVHKRKELVQDVTLDDLDAANALHQRGQDIMSGIGSLMKGSRRREVNKVQSRSELRLSYVDQGVAEVVPGVVFIDEVHISTHGVNSVLQVHMLDIEYFTYFNALFESPNGPYRDSCHQPWYSYSDQVVKVVQLRAITEGLKLGEGVIDRLAEGEKSSFR